MNLIKSRTAKLFAYLCSTVAIVFLIFNLVMFGYWLFADKLSLMQTITAWDVTLTSPSWLALVIIGMAVLLLMMALGQTLKDVAAMADEHRQFV